MRFRRKRRFGRRRFGKRRFGKRRSLRTRIGIRM